MVLQLLSSAIVVFKPSESDVELLHVASLDHKSVSGVSNAIDATSGRRVDAGHVVMLPKQFKVGFIGKD